MAKKLLRIIGQFVLKFFSRKNIEEFIHQLIDAVYDSYVRGDDTTNV